MTAGILGKNYMFTYWQRLFDDDFVTLYKPALKKAGWVAGIRPKIWSYKVMRGFHYNMSLMIRSFDELRITELGMGMGYQFIIGSKVPIDLGFDYGVLFQKSIDGKTRLFPEEDRILVILPLHVKIGYILN